MALLGEKQVERGKKIKNSDLTLLTLRHLSRNVKKILKSVEPCCPVQGPLAHMRIYTKHN